MFPTGHLGYPAWPKSLANPAPALAVLLLGWAANSVAELGNGDWPHFDA